MATPFAKASEIPSLSLLYRLNKLSAPSTPFTPANASSPIAPSARYNSIVSLIRTDITTLPVGAIVNAANNSLLGGGGVDGAIHRAAGPDLVKECRKLDGCDTGDAKITDAYKLPCEKVIHAVGPIYRMEDDPEGKLKSCYSKSLDLARENGLKSIAFSALSTGVYGYPSNAAARAVCEEVRDWLEQNKGDSTEGAVAGIGRIVFCCFEMKDVKAYEEWLPKFFPPTEEDVKSEGSSKEVSDKDKAEAEELKKSMPDPPTTEPLNPGEPATKKQKVLDPTDEDGPDDETDWLKIEKPTEQLDDVEMTESAKETQKLNDRMVVLQDETTEEINDILDDTKPTQQPGGVPRSMLEKDW